MKNITRIILSALIGLLSPLYCGAENLTPKNSQVNTLSHASSQIITIQVGSFKKAEDAEQNLARLNQIFNSVLNCLFED